MASDLQILINHKTILPKTCTNKKTKHVEDINRYRKENEKISCTANYKTREKIGNRKRVRISKKMMASIQPENIP